MLSVNPIARVIVNAMRSAASPKSFDTGLLLIKDTSFQPPIGWLPATAPPPRWPS